MATDSATKVPSQQSVKAFASSADNLSSGTVAIGRLGSSGTASSSTFLRGDNSWQTVSGTTINNNGDNRIITGSATQNTLEGEADLTFDGTNLDLGDDKKIRFGASNDFELFHNGTSNRDEISSSSWIRFTVNGTQRFKVNSSGVAVEGTLLVGSSQIGTTGAITAATLEVTGEGTFNGDTTFTGDNYNVVWDKSDSTLRFADDAKLELGASGALRIEHTGSHSIIEDRGAGDLRLKASQVEIQSGGGEAMAVFNTDGSSELYYDNNKKLETTSAGATVTGTLTASVGFSGNGASITHLDLGDSTNTGQIPVARLGTSGSASSSTFLRGDNVWATPSATDSTKMPLTGGTFTGNVFYNTSGDQKITLSGSTNPMINFQSGTTTKAWIQWYNSEFYVWEQSVNKGIKIGTDFKWNDGSSDQNVIHQGNVGSGGALSAKNVYVNQIHGDGSNLTNVNATTLDSIDSSDFLRSDTSDTMSGTLTIDAGSGGDTLNLKNNSSPMINFKVGNTQKGYLSFIGGRMQLANEQEGCYMKFEDDWTFSNDSGSNWHSVIHQGNVGSGGKLSNKNVYVNQIHGDGSNLTNLPASGGTVDLYAHTSNIAAGKPVAINSSGKVEEIILTESSATPSVDSYQFWDSEGDEANTDISSSAFCTISGVTYIVLFTKDNSNYPHFKVGKFDTTNPKSVTWGTQSSFGNGSTVRNSPDVCAMGNTGRFVSTQGEQGIWANHHLYYWTIDTANLTLTNNSDDEISSYYTANNWRRQGQFEEKNNNYCFFAFIDLSGYVRLIQVKHDGTSYGYSDPSTLSTWGTGTEKGILVSYSNIGSSSGTVLLSWSNGSNQYAGLVTAPADNITFSSYTTGTVWSIGSNTKFDIRGSHCGFISSTKCFLSGCNYNNGNAYGLFQLRVFDISGLTITTSGASLTNLSSGSAEMESMFCNWEPSTSRFIFMFNTYYGTSSDRGLNIGDATVSGTTVTVTNSNAVTKNSTAYSGSSSDRWTENYRKGFVQPGDSGTLILTNSISDGNGANMSWLSFITFKQTTHNGEKFIGFTSASINANAEGTINVTGSVNDQVSGLTTGSVYYIGTNGINTTALSPSIRVGMALSSTKLLVGS